MRKIHSLVRISPPSLPPTIFHRETLVNGLKNAICFNPTSNSSTSYKLLLLCAPAGYGKTTLLADFARHTSTPCCWYFLDPSDNDKVTFMEMLIASVRQYFPQFGATLNAQLARCISVNVTNLVELQRFEALIDAFIAAIETDIPERFVLMLCNYHEINTNKDINALVDRLLQHLPEQCIVVIESRAIPSLELALLMAYRQIFGLGSNGLRFTTQDILGLSRLLHAEPLSAVEAEHLTGSFDGWIAGILLGTRLGDLQFLSPEHISSTWGSPAIRMDQQHLFTYLVNEVFQHEAEVYTFLKSVAIFQQMTPALCNALLHITDAHTRLAYVEQQGLFVTRNGDGLQATYTCHPILRELLCAELSRQEPALFTSLHRNAAGLFAAEKNYEQAISHALAASAADFAANLILEVSKSMIFQGYSETVARWIDALPLSALENYPQLLLSRANIHLMQYETAKTLPLLDKVHTLIRDNPSLVDNDSAPIMLAEVFILRSLVFFETGDYLQAQNLSQQALELLPTDERKLRAMAYQRLGACSCLLNDCTIGITHMQQALQLWGRNAEGVTITLLHGNLANAYKMIGNYALSEHHRARAISNCERMGDTWGKINNLISVGAMQRNKGTLVEAEAVLTEALTMARNERFKSGEAYALVNLGTIYQDQELYEKALTVTEDGLNLAYQIGDSYLINFTLCILATIYLAVRDAQTALLLVNQTDIKTGQTTSYEGALCELTRAAILLFQHDYDKAYSCLSTIEHGLQETSLKSLLIRTGINLAACQLARGQLADVVLQMEKVVTLTMQSNLEYIVLVELHHLPELWQAIQSMPNTACLASWRTQSSEGIEGENISSQEPALVHVETSKLRVLALGEPTVLIEDIPITHWRMAKSMELYFFLLDYGRPIRKEKIIATLWPDADEHADQTLRSAIYYLRKVIGESCIVYTASTYAFDLVPLYGEQVWYDVAAFQECYVSAKDALADEDTLHAENLLLEAVSMYRGDYVQSFYSDWCTTRRDELRRIYLDARHQLALLAWNREDFDECIVHWQHILAIDTCQEDAHYGLMRCYARMRKRGLALRQYQRCLDALQEELSVTPGPTIQKFYLRLAGKADIETAKIPKATDAAALG